MTMMYYIKTGPVIDGDLVIQGSTLEPKYGPVLCIVEYAEDEQSGFKVIHSISSRMSQINFICTYYRRS